MKCENKLDKIHSLPPGFEKSKKDVCQFIRKCANSSKDKEIQIGENESISEDLFKEFTDLNKIEQLIFDKMAEEEGGIFFF